MEDHTRAGFQREGPRGDELLLLLALDRSKTRQLGPAHLHN